MTLEITRLGDSRVSLSLHNGCLSRAVQDGEQLLDFSNSMQKTRICI